jgi:hypothetical protein
VATKDIILTLGVMLVAGLACQLVADVVRAPRMLVLLLAGTVLGPSVTDAIDVPLDSTAAELLLTLGSRSSSSSEGSSSRSGCSAA